MKMRKQITSFGYWKNHHQSPVLSKSFSNNYDLCWKSLKVVKHALLCLLLFVGLSLPEAYALKGQDGSHDPSGLVREGNRFYQFTTGNGIYSAYSTDLITWTSSPSTVFRIGTWPSWINSAVPGFGGHFWAPDVINMNGRWYVYYSCSSWGSSRSAIGVATSTSLQGPWTDLGMVVSSSSSSNINAIDPGLFRDTDGKVYMTYGSFAGGIGVVEIDPGTAKIRSGASVVKVIAGGSNWEAPYMVKEGSYYYLFVNRGSCCRGKSSTYYIQVGRATSPTGPYSGWRTVLGTSGRYIGPGHFGLMRHNGSNFVSIHYYDGNTANGDAKLDILNMGFSGGWPFLTRDWIAAGQYRVTNRNSGLVWDAWGCTGAAGQAIAQGPWTGANCQKWNFTPVGDGAFRITCQQGGRSADIVNCNAGNGAKVQLYDWLNNNCQKFKIERTADGSHVFTSLTGNRVVEVPGASTASGVQLALWDYNGNNGQKWTIGSASARLAIASEENNASELNIYPNPSPSGKFTIELGSLAKENASIVVTNKQGRIVYRKETSSQDKALVEGNLDPGLYIVKVKGKGQVITKKLLIE